MGKNEPDKPEKKINLTCTRQVMIFFPLKRVFIEEEVEKLSLLSGFEEFQLQHLRQAQESC